MKHIIFSLTICFATTVQAAYLDVWVGAGPNACSGDCSQEWAESQLTPEERLELRHVQLTSPSPAPIFIFDGDVFSWMSYSEQGYPVGYRTTTVAALESPERALGWEMASGWAFVRIDSCQNWAIIRRDGRRIPVLSKTYAASVTKTPDVWAPAEFWQDTSFPPTLFAPPSEHTPPILVASTPPIMETPPAVPLPASFFLLLAGVFGLFFGRKIL